MVDAKIGEKILIHLLVFSICDLRHRQLNPEKGEDITKLLTLKSVVIHLKRLLDGCNIQT